GEIASVDRIVDRLVKAAGPGTIVAVAADHGEALGGHGEATHGVFLYDETLHVPLVIRLPGVGSGFSRTARRVTTRVRLADLAPTLLDAAGLPRPSAMQGESLIPLVRLKPDPTGTTATGTTAAGTGAGRLGGFRGWGGGGGGVGWVGGVGWGGGEGGGGGAKRVGGARRVGGGGGVRWGGWRAHRSGGRRTAGVARVRRRIGEHPGRRRSRPQGPHRRRQHAARRDDRRRGRAVRASDSVAGAGDCARTGNSDRPAQPGHR